MKDKLSILITTGIYPPEIGGPAEYAKNLKEIWTHQGHVVHVEVFSRLNHIKTGIRHLIYFFKIIPYIYRADFILTLDTFSAALPTVCASLLFRKKIILRTGGDFLWEQYVERTKNKVLLREFYLKHIHSFTTKERIIFFLIRFVLQHVDTIIWSTAWQRDIFMKPYGLYHVKHSVIENYYGERRPPHTAHTMHFIGASRALVWKNIDVLEKVFNLPSVKDAGGVLDLTKVPHAFFLDTIQASYAVIVASLGDISPNTILDAIMCQKPFIVTKETGLYDRIKDIALFVDPCDLHDIEAKVLWLLKPENYELQCKKIREFTFVHTWEQIASEYLAVVG